MRKQYELTIIIGSATLPEAFKRDVIARTCYYSGGCTVHNGTGYWHEDGDSHKDVYTSQLGAEDALCISLTCESHKVEGIYEALQSDIAGLVLEHGADVDWVHVQQTEIEGRHFSVKARNARK